jgi:hypothetical protein
MDITPNVNLLRSLRGERISYPILIGEGIDNGFDAGARNINISISDETVAFQDDGCGITKAKLRSLFSLGDHGALSTTQLGRFGIGIKAQAVNAGDVFQVYSASQDGRFMASVNWVQLLAGGKWQIEDPAWRPAIVGAPFGTTITISRLRKPQRFTIDQLLQDVAERFYPAIADGRSIYINGIKVPLLVDPDMTDVIDANLSLLGGRAAHLKAGILKNPGPLNRVSVAYKHRVIISKKPFGCGDYGGGLNKMFARVRISGSWHFEKFKDGLTDENERDELEEAILSYLSPILEKCSTA